jgi:hypothetical protein
MRVPAAGAAVFVWANAMVTIIAIAKILITGFILPHLL